MTTVLLAGREIGVVADPPRLLAAWQRRVGEFVAEGSPDSMVEIERDERIDLRELSAAVAALQGARRAGPAAGGLLHCDGGRLRVRAPAAAFAEPRPDGWPRLINTLLCAAHNTRYRERDEAAVWLVHACAVVLPSGGAILVLGPSGAGKSTFAALAGRCVRVLQDEAVAIRVDRARPGTLIASGTPMAGDVPPKRGEAPVRALLLLARDGEPGLHRATGEWLLPRLLPQIFLPAPPFPSAAELHEAQARRLDGALRLGAGVPAFTLTYKPTAGTVADLIARLDEALR